MLVLHLGSIFLPFQMLSLPEGLIYFINVLKYKRPIFLRLKYMFPHLTESVEATKFLFVTSVLCLNPSSGIIGTAH